ncbi:MAG: toll/interleukin-1 receptor domain-containing protein [Nitrososphaerales archaeon]
MAFEVFVSHSFGDSMMVDKIRSSLEIEGVKAYVAEADPRYGEALPAKIEKAIDSSDALIVILTSQANVSASVNQEIGYAKKAGKLLIPLVEDGVAVGVMLQGLEFVKFSIDRIEDVFKDVVDYIAKRASEKERKDWSNTSSRVLIAFVVIAVFSIVAIVALTRRK